MNPFNNTVAINDPQKLFGRRHELRRIYSAVANKQCISLFGLPRIGKTSILKCLPLPEMQQHFEQKIGNCIFVYIDLEEHVQKTSKEFFETLCRSIVTQSRGLLELVYNARRGEDGFTDVLEQVAERNFHLILEIDMFDEIVKNAQFDEYFLGFLRAQVNTRSITYVTASIASLDKISQRFTQGSPFFNIFGSCPLGPLFHDDAQELMLMSSNQEACLFSEEEVEWILELAGYHPYFIQRVCYYLYEEKFLHGITRINRDRVRDQAYGDLLSSFSYIWRKLSEEQQRLLKYDTKKEIPELAKSALFRKFVLETFHVQPFDMTTAELQKVLGKIDNSKFLGESRLADLKIVSQNYKKDTVLSIVEKGKAVYQILQKAFECLHGSGTRNDLDTSWRSYNILYYRFFKYHMENTQVASRLGFSPRQYYRYRNQALEELSTVLVQMETSANREEYE